MSKVLTETQEFN